MEIFDVFSMNEIENYPAAGEFFLENVILKVSQTHFSKDFYPKGGPMPPPWLRQGGGINFSRGGGNAPPRGGGAWSTLVPLLNDRLSCIQDAIRFRSFRVPPYTFLFCEWAVGV